MNSYATVYIKHQPIIYKTAFSFSLYIYLIIFFSDPKCLNIVSCSLSYYGNTISSSIYTHTHVPALITKNIKAYTAQKNKYRHKGKYITKHKTYMPYKQAAKL